MFSCELNYETLDVQWFLDDRLIHTSHTSKIQNSGTVYTLVLKKLTPQESRVTFRAVGISESTILRVKGQCTDGSTPYIKQSQAPSLLGCSCWIFNSHLLLLLPFYFWNRRKLSHKCQKEPPPQNIYKVPAPSAVQTNPQVNRFFKILYESLHHHCIQ